MQVSNPLWCLYLRHYIQESLIYFELTRSALTDNPIDHDPAVKQQIENYVQQNFSDAVRLYLQLTKVKSAQAQNYAFFCLEFVRCFENRSIGLLIQTGLSSTCPYLQFEILRKLSHCDYKQLRERYDSLIQLFSMVIKFQRLEYGAKQILIMFLQQMYQLYGITVIEELVERVDGVLGLC